MSSPLPHAIGPRSIAFFDVDGTLVPGTSSAQHLAAQLGHLDVLAEAEAAWDAGLVDARHVEELDARGWTGTSESQVREWLVSLPLVDGISEVLAWCAEQRVVPVLATLAWQPVGAYLCDTYGFTSCSGPSLEVLDGRYTGTALDSWDEYAKRDFAARVASAAGLPLRECIAIGDSRSDLPLFGEVGLAIAFNAEEKARAIAHARIDSSDLRTVLPVVGEWLNGSDSVRRPGLLPGWRTVSSDSRRSDPPGLHPAHRPTP
jgi:phosphoserine phosphatase